MNLLFSIIKAIVITPFVSLLLFPYLFSSRITFSLKFKIMKYGISLPIFLCDPVSKIGSKRINFKKLKIISLQCALIPIIDEVVDYEGLSEDVLLELFSNYDEYESSVGSIKIFSLIIDKLKGEDALTKGSFKEMLDAQLASRRQYDLDMSEQDLREIIYNKGGASIFHLVNVSIGEVSYGNKELFYKIGFWLQLIDDYGDKEIDDSMNVRTLANIMKNTEYLALINSIKSEVIVSITNLDGDAKGKKHLLHNLKLYESLYIGK